MKGFGRQIKTGARPTGSVEGLNLEAIQARFSSTDPGAVIDAGITYCLVADNLSEAEDEVARAIKYLTDHWQGDAADTALKELRKLEANARELSTRSRQTGDTLQRYGTILDKYQAVTLDPGFIRTKSDDRYAQQLMARLNTRTAEAYDALPDQVGLADANVSPASATAPSSAGGTVSGASGGGSSALSGPAGHGHGGAGTDGPGARVGSGGDAVGGGTDLAGVAPGGPGTGLGPNGLGLGGGGAMPGAGAVPGGAVGSPGAGTTAFIGPGAGPGRGVAGGRGAGLGRSGVIGAGGVMGGAPAGDSDDDERRRDFWLAEDRDTWSGDGEIVSAVIGQEDHRPPPSGDDPAAVDVADLDDGRDRLIEELDPGVTELSTLDDGDVEIVELDAEDGDADSADEPDYDEIDEFLDEVLGDDDFGDLRT